MLTHTLYEGQNVELPMATNQISYHLDRNAFASDWMHIIPHQIEAYKVLTFVREK